MNVSQKYDGVKDHLDAVASEDTAPRKTTRQYLKMVVDYAKLCLAQHDLQDAEMAEYDLSMQTEMSEAA